MKRIVAAACFVMVASLSSIAGAQQGAATVATEYVDVEGNKIGYRSIGSGHPLVLLNRMRGTLDTWDPLFLDQLAQTHRVVTVDVPGTGYSAGTLPTDMGDVATFVNAFANRISLKRFAVLGWSWGGLVAQTLLLKYPEMVSHAILLGTAPPGPGQAQIQQVWLERALKPVTSAIFFARCGHCLVLPSCLRRPTI